MGGGERGIDNKPKGADCLEFYKPDVVIIQLGIVDCAPRLLYDLERKLLNRVPSGLSNLYINQIKKMRKRSYYNTFVIPAKFRNNLNVYFKRCQKEQVEKVIYIAISYPDYTLNDKNPLIYRNVDYYNEIVHEVASNYEFVKIIKPLDSRDHSERIFQDGYHPNVLGHDLVSRMLADYI